jgi:flagella basal body P-ring formation protein FlgA
MKILHTAIIVLFALLSQQALAQAPAPTQDRDAVRKTVEQYLRTQTMGLPGQVKIKIGQIDPHLNVPSCAAPEAFAPTGSKLWGKTTVGVRCTAPTPWTIYVSATVQVLAQYIATAKPLAQGQIVDSTDIVELQGDLAALPSGIITDPSQAVGRTLAVSLQAGIPLRQDSLRSQQAIKQGQTVRVVSTGEGFQVSTEARALNNAAIGQVVQARTLAGQVVSGIAKEGGVLEVTH